MPGLLYLTPAYCQMLANAAGEMPQTPNLEQIKQFTPILLHLEDAAHSLLAGYRNQDLIWAFVGITRFYEGQGLYQQAEPWYEKCVEATTQRLGIDHPDVATSLNNLALLYNNQGRYEAAEPLYKRAISISEQKRGADHPITVLYRENLQRLQQETAQPSSSPQLAERSKGWNWLKRLLP